MRWSVRRSFVWISELLLLPLTALADSDLIYLEAQAVGGWSSARGQMVYHSMMDHDLMQKNGVGLDWLHRFSGANGDFGIFALQARLVWEDVKDTVRPQVYNLYYRGKTAYGDWWLGHSRVAYGLASYWDTHAELIGDLTMMGVGFERDWGGGWSYDTDWGNLASSLTTGSGAYPYERNGNFLVAGRLGYGVLAYDNWTTGLSVMGGRVRDVMGTRRLSQRLKDEMLVGGDLCWLDEALEHRLELDVGAVDGSEAAAALYRLTWNLDDENRFKLEAQPALTWMERSFDWSGAAGFSWQITDTLSFRAMYRYRHAEHDSTVIGQLYYYFPL